MTIRESSIRLGDKRGQVQFIELIGNALAGVAKLDLSPFLPPWLKNICSVPLRLRSILLCLHNTSLIPFINNHEFLTLPQSTHLFMPDEQGQTIVLF